MVRDGAPPSLYEPGQPSANDWAWNVFGGNFNFPITIGVTEGNPDLGSETAETYTFGMVLNFDSVTLAIDFYEIELANAIETPSHAAVYQQRLDPVYNPLIASAPGTYTGAELAVANRFCDLINREYVGGTPLTPGNFGAARTFDARYINQGTLTSEGVDIQLDWGRDFDNGGALNLSLIASILDVFSEAAFPGALPIEFTGTQSNSSFDYQTFVSATYASGPWSVGIRWAHMPSLLPVPGSNLSTNFGVNAHDETDLFSSWSFNDRYRLRFGIDNLFNEDPAVVGATTANNALGSTSSNYDQFGRRYYVGLSISL
ncbi:MAG TPA: TonB-dependent receptor [Gammaproteobacteria bacterium]|nr:TonB-dependent receptor [Gammaproteobacteria bacterium]